MTKTRITAAAVAGFTLLGTGLWMYRRAEASEAPAYRYAQVERGSLQATVSATGTLGAVRTVQVGTQVSGQVSAIYADFNDKVKKGQLIARIDPTLQQQAVQDAQAGLERAQAQLALARDEYDRNKTLYDAQIVTASEFGTVQSNYTVAKANVKSAQISLDRARQNLAYTNVYAPIDGVVVERNVDVGQTVAASLSAPQLFLIANDLGEMQILASVDESDIGRIEDGQPVTFTVQSYPNESFAGKVQQVRLQSKTQDNVVNYTAVIGVENKGGKLLPGMTATVQFVTGSADSVLLVPNAALRLRPTAEMQAQAAASGNAAAPSRTDSARAQGGAGITDSARARFAAMRAQRAAAGGGGTATGSAAAQLWYVGKDGKLAVARVRTGLSDGTRTEVSGRAIEAGMQVIVGVGGQTTSAAGGAAQGTQATKTTNPLQPQAPRGGPAGGPRGF